ncbi:MAG: hypothetical protein WEB03_04185 [Nitriliruptor sp.]|uniref:hypothetical protein n=1 Tax=Nitriliruptor sp. TaxID=2448056 RepID=UPI0034A03F1B
MRRWPGFAASLAVLAALTTACTSADQGPVDVAIVELVEDQDALHGRQVTTRGVVRSFDEPLHHWIEDEDQNRVELTPQELVSPHLGDRIEVTGRYTFRDDEGRRIAIEDLEVLDEGDLDSA